MRLVVIRILSVLTLATLANCESCGDDDVAGCEVAQLDGGVSIQCGDDDAIIIPTPAESCKVTANPGGSFTITCPDGGTVTVPSPRPDAGIDAGIDGSLPPPLASVVHYAGATTTACGSCHDAAENKIHFSTMTTLVDGKPIEGCPTCHKESGPNAVSIAHARPELGAPGFKVEILGASIDPGTRKPSVNLKIQDSSGKPLDRTGVSINFTVAHVPPVASVSNTQVLIPGPYVSYLTKTATQLDNPDYPLDGTPRVVQQGTSDSSGTYVETGPGLYTYTFAAALPADYDVNQTHIIGDYATRTVGPVRWVSNATFAFVPANPAAPPGTRKVVHTETCNSCHSPLSAHGGSRQEVQVCLTCHSQGSVDPESNNSIDLNVMIHKIHMGAQLPFVKAGGQYGIVGRNNETADFSHAAYPRDIVQCQSCHTDSDDDRWVSNGTTAVCTSCHEDIFQPGVHAFPFEDPTTVVCGNSACHAPGGNVRDARESHLTFLNTDAPILDISIVSATVANADAAPALKVKALRGTRLSGATQPVTSVDNLSTLNVFFNGPNTDFVSNGHDIKQYSKADLVGLTASSTPGEFTFSLPQTLRQAAGTAGDVSKDSYTVAVRAAYDPTPGAAPDNDRVDMIKNPTAAISAVGTAAARKAVVDTAKCNNCHGDLRAHGGDILARNVEECIMCHSATLETSPRQSGNKEPGPTTSLRFSQLVHRVHASGMAVQPYVLYGYAAAAPYPQIDFSDVGFPGDQKNCLACHVEGTNTLPVTASPTFTQTLILDANGQPIKE